MSKEIKNWDINIKTSRLLAETDFISYLTFCDNYFFIFGGEDVFKGDVKIVRNITDLKNHYGGNLKLKVYKFTKGTLLENILLSIIDSKNYVVKIEDFTLIERFCSNNFFISLKIYIKLQHYNVISKCLTKMIKTV